MTTINLKDFYYWYLTDVLVEVPDEVAEELMASKRREAAHAERVRYNIRPRENMHASKALITSFCALSK